MLFDAVARLRRLDRGLAVRAGLVTATYGVSALVLLATVVVLRGAVSGRDLRALLGFFFVASTAAGLDPGTVKAAALQPRGALDRPVASYMLVDAVKAVAAAPILALVWRFAEPQTTWSVLAWLPLVCVAGFIVTDLRVILDLQGRHAAAIGLKQGLTAGGHALAGLLLIAGMSMPMAIGVSTLARLASAGVIAVHIDAGRTASVWEEAQAMFCDLRWVDFAATSVLGSASGSADRVLGLRYLAPAAYGAYYLTFEALSRFWLIPYLLTPILFARSVTGQSARSLATGAWLLTAVAGLLLICGVAGVSVAAPKLIPALVGARLLLPTLAMTVAVVLGSFAQLRVAQLQAAGWSRLVMAVTLATGAVSAAVFFIGAVRFGAAGLMYGWAIRTTIELAVVLCVGSSRRGPPSVRRSRRGDAATVGPL